MTDFFYPHLDEQTLKNVDIVRELAAAHPAYWLEHPYSSVTEERLKRWFKTLAPARSTPPSDKPKKDVEPTVYDDDFDMMYYESKKLFEELRNVKDEGEGLSPSEKMSYYRTCTNLMDKMITAQEKAKNLKNLHDFYNGVLDAMENVLSPSQRNEVVERLKSLSKGE